MPTLLVTGAAGQLGQRVIANLLESQKVPPGNIVAGTRNPATLDNLAARGVTVRKVDFDDPGLAAAFQGVERLLIISTNALDTTGRRLAQHKAAVAAAKQAGVQHLFYTSMPNPAESLVLFAPDHQGTEQAIAASGIPYTILRDAWYQENLLRSLPKVLASGKWFTATGDGRTPYVSREDCARAAAAALAASAPQNGARYDISGPEALSVAQIAAIAAETAGKPIEVIPVSAEQLKQNLLAAGVPEYFATLTVSIESNIRAGRFDVVSDAVQRLTGRAPQTLQAFLRANRAALG